VAARVEAIDGDDLIRLVQHELPVVRPAVDDASGTGSLGDDQSAAQADLVTCQVDELHLRRNDDRLKPAASHAVSAAPAHRDGCNRSG